MKLYLLEVNYTNPDDKQIYKFKDLGLAIKYYREAKACNLEAYIRTDDGYIIEVSDNYFQQNR